MAATNWLQIKMKARKDLHDTLSVPSKHISAATGMVSDCKVRVHTKLQLAGDVDYQGFMELSDGSVIVRCSIQEARALQFSEGDKIIYNNMEYILHVRLDDDGVFLESWQATHTQGKFYP